MSHSSSVKSKKRHSYLTENVGCVQDRDRERKTGMKVKHCSFNLLGLSVRDMDLWIYGFVDALGYKVMNLNK